MVDVMYACILMCVLILVSPDFGIIILVSSFWYHFGSILGFWYCQVGATARPSSSAAGQHLIIFHNLLVLVPVAVFEQPEAAAFMFAGSFHIHVPLVAIIDAPCWPSLFASSKSASKIVTAPVDARTSE